MDWLEILDIVIFRYFLVSMNVNLWGVRTHTHTQIYKVKNGAICCNVVRFGACDLELYIVKGFPKTDIFCDPDFLPGTCGKRHFFTWCPHGATSSKASTWKRWALYFQGYLWSQVGPWIVDVCDLFSTRNRGALLGAHHASVFPRPHPPAKQTTSTSPFFSPKPG